MYISGVPVPAGTCLSSLVRCLPASNATRLPVLRACLEVPCLLRMLSGLAHHATPPNLLGLTHIPNHPWCGRSAYDHATAVALLLGLSDRLSSTLSLACPRHEHMDGGICCQCTTVPPHPRRQLLCPTRNIII